MVAVLLAFVMGMPTGAGCAWLLFHWRALRREPVLLRRHTETELDAIIRKELRLK